MEIRLYQDSDKELWDSYVTSHPSASHCHLAAWKPIVENSYRHKTYYLIAEEHAVSPKNSDKLNAPYLGQNSARIAGILPLVHLKSLLFGNQLVSVPFLNYGGILADGEETEKMLFSEAVRLGQKLRVDKIEIRHIKPLQYLPHLNATHPNAPTNPSNHINATSSIDSNSPIHFRTMTHKVRMLLELPGSGEDLLKSFKPKLKSQIKRPQKEGMKATIGGGELLDSFYEVFSINMRDLGSPVHSKEFFRQVCLQFNENARIGIVNYKGTPVAAGIICCFKDTTEIPWASSLRKYSQFSPNMLLYWTLLDYSCKKGDKYFDFGRSTPGGGTYKFKEQWGAKPTTLNWQVIFLNSQRIDTYDSEKSKFEKLIYYWQKLPVSFTRIAGPKIRKNIGL